MTPGFWDIMYVFAILVVLAGILYGVLYLMKRFLYGGKLSQSGGMSIEVIANQVLMPKKYISIVKINEKLLVLGISEQSITHLDTIEEIPPELLALAASRENKPNFWDLMKQNLGKK
jgi:flagellar protein FliO/FliZ